MNIKVVVELQVKEDELEQIRPLFATLLQGTRNRDGNEGVLVYTDQENPTAIILIEQWVSRDLYEQYNRWRAKRGDLANLVKRLVQPPKRRYLDLIGV